jgi:hypothetical protein
MAGNQDLVVIGGVCLGNRPRLEFKSGDVLFGS